MASTTPPSLTVSDESDEYDSSCHSSCDSTCPESPESDSDSDESPTKPHTGGGPKHDVKTRLQALPLLEY